MLVEGAFDPGVNMQEIESSAAKVTSADAPPGQKLAAFDEIVGFLRVNPDYAPAGSLSTFASGPQQREMFHGGQGLASNPAGTVAGAILRRTM